MLFLLFCIECYEYTSVGATWARKYTLVQFFFRPFCPFSTSPCCIGNFFCWLVMCVAWMHFYKPICFCFVDFIHSFSILSDDRSKASSKRFLHIVRSRASSFKWQYPLLSLRSSSSFLRLLPRLLVTFISPFIYPSITCFRRQFLRKMWPIQLAYRFLISCRIFLCSLTLSNTSSFLTWSVQLIFSILLQHYISKLSRYFWSSARSVQVSAPY